MGDEMETLWRRHDEISFCFLGLRSHIFFVVV